MLVQHPGGKEPGRRELEEGQWSWRQGTERRKLVEGDWRKGTGGRELELRELTEGEWRKGTWGRELVVTGRTGGKGAGRILTVK